MVLSDWLFAKGGLGTYGRVRNHEPAKEIQIMEQQEPHNAEAYYVPVAKKLSGLLMGISERTPKRDSCLRQTRAKLISERHPRK